MKRDAQARSLEAEKARMKHPPWPAELSRRRSWALSGTATASDLIVPNVAICQLPLWYIGHICRTEKDDVLAEHVPLAATLVPPLHYRWTCLPFRRFRVD